MLFPQWRLKIREARVAFHQGRWEEASELLVQKSVREFLPAKRLSLEVAGRFADRAKSRLEAGDSMAGWDDLRQATRLGGYEEEIAQIRAGHLARGVDKVRRYLLRGEYALAAEQIARLEQRRLGGDQVRAWKLIVHLITRAKQLDHRGQHAEAAEMLQRAKNILPDPSDNLGRELGARRQQLLEKVPISRSLATQLHEALAEQDYRRVLKTADEMLELAPEHTAARQARRKAWKAVGMAPTLLHQHVPFERHGSNGAIQGSSPRRPSEETASMTDPRTPSRRIVAWIDEVGGYLICLGNEICLGQPSAAPGADIPILADLSRRHAIIRREGEAYVLSPIHQVELDGIRLKEPTLLTDGAEIKLGESVRLRFRKPHALSTTACLTLESHHSTQMAVRNVVLMSESCVLGPQSHSHICCPKWKADLVLFRDGDRLRFRTQTLVEVNGEPGASEQAICQSCRIEGEDFALSIEEI